MESVDMVKVPPMQVRVGKVLADGEVVGSDVFTMEHFGGVLPNVGDHFTLIYSVDDYETVTVQKRHFVTQAHSRHVHWQLVVKASEACSQYTQVVINVLAVNEYLEAAQRGQPMPEVVAKRRKVNSGR